MRPRMIRALALAVAVVACARPAEAQPRGLFVGGSVIADVDRTNSRLTDRAALSSNFVVGLKLSPHVGVRLFLDSPRQEQREAEGVYMRRPGDLPVRERLTRTRRSLTYALVADFHAQVTRRMALAVTYGLAEVTHDEVAVVAREQVRPDGTLLPLPDLRQTGDFDWTGLAVGVETAVALSRRIEVVPEVRVIYFVFSDSGSPYIIRSGLGLRWRFL